MAADAGLTVREHVPLAPLTTLRLGGAARWFATATEPSHLLTALEWVSQRRVPLFVLGGGSNIVVSDAGFDGLVLRMAIGGTVFEAAGPATRVIAGAGESWDALVAATVARGLAGIECLSGIPGTVGGTPIQNVGAYGQEVAETIEAVTVFDTTRQELFTYPAAECGFSYRSSRFRTHPGQGIVTRVAFRLRHGDGRVLYPDVQRWCEREGVVHPTPADVRAAVLAIRRGKGMVVDAADPDSRSVGSFFTNPVLTSSVRDEIARRAGTAPPAYPAGDDAVKIPAAWLIERAGFHRGYGQGPVGISTRHPLAIVNRGEAAARDVLRLAVEIKRGVYARFGVSLRPEPIFVGFVDDADVTYLVRR